MILAALVVLGGIIISCASRIRSALAVFTGSGNSPASCGALLFKPRFWKKAKIATGCKFRGVTFRLPGNVLPMI